MKKLVKCCVDCGVVFKIEAGVLCCSKHKSSCPDCSIQDHIDGNEHGLVFTAKAKLGKKVLVKVR